MKKGKRKIQILSLFMAVSMIFLSACGSEGKQTEEVAEVIADSDIADIEGEESETVEVQGERKERKRKLKKWKKNLWLFVFLMLKKMNLNFARI